MMHNFDNIFTVLAANHIWQSFVIVGLVWAGLKFHKRMGAEARSWVWMTTFILAAVLPFATLLPGEGAVPSLTVSSSLVREPVAVTPALAQENRIALEQPAIQFAEESSNISLPGIQLTLLFIWALGIMWSAFSLVRAYLLSRRLVANSTRLAAHNTAIPRDWPSHVPIRINSDITGPLVTGIGRSIVLIPAGYLDTMEAGEIHQLLAHERGHIERHDVRLVLVQQIIMGLFWWSPAMHWMGRQIALTREMACDERAARRAGNVKTYAGALLKGARQLVMGGRVPLAVGVYEKRALDARIKSLMAAEVCAEQLAPIARPVAVGLCTLAALALIIGWITPRMAPPALAETNVTGDHNSSDDNETDDTGSGLGRYLLMAAQDGDRSAVRAMVKAGVDVNYVSRGDGTALIMAAQYNDLAVAEYLIENGASVNLSVSGDGSPLIMAARYGHRRMAEFLIDRGAEVDLPVKGDGNPLIAASAVGHLNIVQYLVEKGADVNGYVRGDETPLINAAQSGDLEIVKYLVSKGADVNYRVEAPTVRGNGYRSPLSMARERGHKHVEDYLIAQGANQ